MLMLRVYVTKEVMGLKALTCNVAFSINNIQKSRRVNENTRQNVDVAGVVTETCDVYRLHEHIGMIPGDFDVIEVGDTTRAMCRRLCSETYDLTCSGFLYNRRLQKCELSPYNGEWVTRAGLSFDSSSGLEFYRRIRCLG